MPGSRTDHDAIGRERAPVAKNTCPQYDAKLFRTRVEGKTLLITERSKMSTEDLVFTLHWLLGDDGRLTVSSPYGVTTFRRKPLLRYLFAGSP
jgi:hypothetical protein